MKLYTIGYGGRNPHDFVELLKENNITSIIDVRLRPDRAAMGIYARAKTDDKGIQGLLAQVNIEYRSFIELGNVFGELPDWRDRYQNLLNVAGFILCERLNQLSSPFCLMCAERHASECHRKIIADYLVEKGYEVVHLQ
jgi:uncharacterized protein (DUF488 family)